MSPRPAESRQIAHYPCPSNSPRKTLHSAAPRSHLDHSPLAVPPPAPPSDLLPAESAHPGSPTPQEESHSSAPTRPSWSEKSYREAESSATHPAPLPPEISCPPPPS